MTDKPKRTLVKAQTRMVPAPKPRDTTHDRQPGRPKNVLPLYISLEEAIAPKRKLPNTKVPTD